MKKLLFTAAILMGVAFTTSAQQNKTTKPVKDEQAQKDKKAKAEAKAKVDQEAKLRAEKQKEANEAKAKKSKDDMVTNPNGTVGVPDTRVMEAVPATDAQPAAETKKVTPAEDAKTKAKSTKKVVKSGN